MKLLVTIGPALLARTFTKKDGSQGAMYHVPVKFGDDYILTETFADFEGQKRRGIVENAVGNAKIEFTVRTYEDRDGNKRYSQNATLVSFTPIAQPKDEMPKDVPAQPKAPQDAQPVQEAAPADPEAKVADDKEGDLPF